MANSESVSPENFIPKLVMGCELFQLPDAGFGVAVREGEFLRFETNQRLILEAMDGESSLSEVLAKASSQDELVPIRRLVQVVQDLYRGGALQNTADELAAFGFEVHEPSFSVLEKNLKRLLGLRLVDSTLGKVAASVFGLLGKVPASSALLGIILAASLSLIFLLQGEFVNAFPPEPLYFYGSYGMGGLLLYLGGAFAMSLRELFKAWAVGSLGCTMSYAGIQAPFLILAPCFDTRHSFRTGKAGQIRVALAGLVGTFVSVAFLMTGVEQIENSDLFNPQGCALAALGAFAVVVVDLCPFYQTDAGLVLDGFFPGGNARHHAQVYFQRRYLSGLKTISLFAGELKLILLVVLSLGWLYAGLVYFTRLLSEVLLPSLPPILFADNRAEGVLVFFLTLMTLAVILGVLGLFCLTLIRVFRGDGGLTLANPREVESDVGAVQSAINQNPLFEVLDDTTKAELAGVVTTLEFNPGQNIVVQGHEAHQFFMLVQGSADVIQSADSGVETFLASLGPSDSFGEMALIDGGKRQASVRATTPTQVYALERGHFVDAISKSGASPDEVVDVLRSSSAIRKSEILGALVPASLRRLRELLVREQVPSNTVIIEEGAVGNQFYLIQACF